MIDSIVVHQCSEMNELDEGGESDGVRVRPITNAIGKQEKCRPKQFSPRPEEVIVHLFDRGEVAEHYTAQLGNDIFELVTDGSL